MNLKLFSLCAALAATAGPALAFTRVGISLNIGIPAPVIVRAAPPRHDVEVVATSPGAGYIWVAGHYVWTGAEWAWVPGAWVMPPQAGTVWVEGRWDGASRNWTAGHWERVQASAPAAIVIRTAPPPLRHEHRSHRPGPHYVWINGYWAGRGGQHVWVAGRWELPPRGRQAWVEPRWERRGDGYVFIEGRWR